MANRRPVRDSPGALGWRRGPVVLRKPGNAGGGKGPWFKTNAGRSEGPGDWATYPLRKGFRNCRRHYTRKRRLSPALASMPCTTSGTARTFFTLPMPSAAPIGVRRAWMGRSSRISRRMGCSGGWVNWHKRSERRGIDRTPLDECLSRKPMASSGPWASRPCGIGSA